tara:strand:+ start:5177 stop:6166 length:990 start_codon:yes stop_codon:yes gene_type:complete
MEDFNFKNLNILVTGGAGFIGSNLCDFLVQLGCKNVVCLDNFSTGCKKNIKHLLSKTNFNLIEGDIRNISDCNKACRDIDYVLHQAALGSVPRSVKDPITTNDVNISGFLNMLIACRDNHIKRFIFAASSSTYGDSNFLPKIEEKIGNPLSPYAITKYVNELYAKIFNDLYGLEYIGLRYFNVFGRKQDANSTYAAVIPKFIKKFINHESPVINGDGSFSRDFTYIDNIIEINILSIIVQNKSAINNIYNAACGERTSLLDLSNYLKEILKEYDKNIEKIEIIHGPEREGDIPHSLASIEKAKNNLNYFPKYNLKEGLKESINWYFKNL